MQWFEWIASPAFLLEKQGESTKHGPGGLKDMDPVHGLYLWIITSKSDKICNVNTWKYSEAKIQKSKPELRNSYGNADYFYSRRKYSNISCQSHSVCLR